ncbi:MAG: MurR/RpiR family transcriptional regulator [Candidatus Planktophila sp.]|nr:MurR/RpiR family transcriptional regulator [Candidatus Planktophila sp.]
MAVSLKSPSTNSTSYSDLLGEIKSSFKSFHASEASIANCVLRDPHGVSLLNISQLADFSKTSVASVVRFSKAIGYKGFPEFRRALISEVSRNGLDTQNISELDSGIELEDSIEEVIRKIALADSRAIQTTAERLDINSFMRTVDAWNSAQTIGIFGLASSGYVAMDLQLKLNRQGKSTTAWSDAHTALTSVSLLKAGDCLVAISHSGTTIDVVDVMQAFKSRGISIILITNALRSTATALADIVLHTSARETTFRSGATASRIAQLTVVDCLCVALAQRNWSGTKSALEESRAAVGSRSGAKVSADEGMRSQPSNRKRGGNK